MPRTRRKSVYSNVLIIGILLIIAGLMIANLDQPYTSDLSGTQLIGIVIIIAGIIFFVTKFYY